MDDKMLNRFVSVKWKWILFVMKAYFIRDFNFVYVVEAFTTLCWKAIL